MLDASDDLLIRIGLAAPAIDLRPTGYAGLDAVPRRIVLDNLLIQPAGCFPVALLLAWALELTPDSVRLESDTSARRSPAVPIGRTIDFAIIGVLVCAVQDC